LSKTDSNPIFAVINQALSSLFTFGILILASRTLPVNEFGIYSLLVVAMVIFSLAPQAFVLMPMMSMSKDFNTLKPQIYSNLFIFFIFLIVSLGLVVFLYYFNSSLVEKYVSLMPIIFWIISFQFHEFLKRILYIGDMHKETIFYEIVKAVCALVSLTFFFILNEGLNIDDILVGISVGYLCFSLVVIYKIDFFKIPTINPTNNFRKNYAFGKWIFLGNGISYIQNNFFVYITALLLTIETVAGLNAVRSLIGFSTVIFLAIDNYLAPKLAATYQNEGLEPLISKVFSFYIRIGWLFAIVYIMIGLFSESLITIIFGEIYADSSIYLKYFLVASFLSFMVRPYLILSRTIHVTNIIFRGSIFPAIFAVIFSYPLIYIYDDMGALIMAVLGSLFLLMCTAFFFWNHKIKYLDNFDKKKEFN
tara:strand:- start:2127 stop:3386 length:1260 start_codon:yes stop_codon:yes gene_type:complete